VRALTVVAGTVVAGTGTGIYLSTDSGAHWKAMDAGLPAGQQARDVRGLAAHGDSEVFAGVFGGGVYLSVPPFTGWTAMNAGLKNLNIQSVSATDSLLFAGTQNGAVWSRPLSQLAIPGRVTRGTGAPQVRRGMVALKGNSVLYSVPYATRLSVRIFDVSGRLADVVVDKWQAAGNYVAPLPAGRLPSGIYLLDFNAGGYRIARRFTIVR
jgi:hypothetical protein